MSARRETPGPTSLALVEALPAIVWEADGETDEMVYVSSGARTILGHDPATWVREPAFWEEHVHPDDRESAIAARRRIVVEGVGARLRYRFAAADGSYRAFEDVVQAIVDGGGHRRVAGVMLEVPDEPTPEPVRAAPRAPRLDPHLQQVLDSLADGVYYVDLDRRITYWNQGAERLSGYAPAGMLGRLCYSGILAHVDAESTKLCFGRCPLAATMADGANREAQVWLRHHDGSRRPVQVRTAPVRNDDGVITGAVEVFSDASSVIAARDAAEAARREALTDVLTGLPNRRLLDAAVPASLEAAANGSGVAFLLADIDHFRDFNNRFGHAVGDAALRAVAATLRGAARAGDVVGRWGGEEFAIVAAGLDEPGASAFAERLLALVRATDVPVPDGTEPVRLSLGVTLATDGDTPASLFARADAALYEAKAAGRDRYVARWPAGSDPARA